MRKKFEVNEEEGEEETRRRGEGYEERDMRRGT